MEKKLLNDNPVEYTTPNSIAAIWNLILPGFGQLMQGRVMPGLIWAILVACGYFSFFWPGVLLHALSILDVAFYKGNGSFMSINTLTKKFLFLGLIAFALVYIAVRSFN